MIHLEMLKKRKVQYALGAIVASVIAMAANGTWDEYTVQTLLDNIKWVAAAVILGHAGEDAARHMANGRNGNGGS